MVQETCMVQDTWFFWPRRSSPSPAESEAPTWLRGALHPRGGVHRVTKDGELGQLGAYKPRNHRPSMHPDTDARRLPVMRGHDGLGTA